MTFDNLHSHTGVEGSVLASGIWYLAIFGHRVESSRVVSALVIEHRFSSTKACFYIMMGRHYQRWCWGAEE